ncbi:MAG: nucleotidyltransferase domain-containing protein [Nanoarchaeota archaeon]|nr:nucleotidyltransferase domain-containing protein [Nanoarchaeota archaeon]MBU0977595.1 nucleotidyltransferase domain-containing protein [Nanoarchaeota archaeon]
MDKELKRFMGKLKNVHGFNRVRFVILFGSRAEKKARKDSDYDLAVYFDGDKNERFKFRVSVSEDERFDVHIFQDLPLYIRKEVLKGKVLYAEDLSFVYDIAYETIKAFEDFKKYYYDYIEMRPVADDQKKSES